MGGQKRDVQKIVQENVYLMINYLFLLFRKKYECLFPTYMIFFTSSFYNIRDTKDFKESPGEDSADMFGYDVRITSWVR